MTTVVRLRTTERETQDAHRHLLRAVADLNDDGRLTPCQRDPEPFTASYLGDDGGQGQRADAARTCRTSCPLVTLCDVYARTAGETFGVWGGVDRTPTKTPTERRSKP